MPPDAIKDWIGVLINGSVTNQMDDNKIKRSALANEGWNLEATLADINAALDSLDVTEGDDDRGVWQLGPAPDDCRSVRDLESTLERRRETTSRRWLSSSRRRPW